MLRLCALVVAIVLPLLTAGCNRSAHLPQAVNDAYGKVKLEMSIDEAKAAVGSEGEEGTYSSLPTNPRPREIYPNLPETADWRVWEAKGKPILILGIVDGKIVFRQVLWNDDGEFKSDTRALPAYR